jgi:hypothetical protein
MKAATTGGALLLLLWTRLMVGQLPTTRDSVRDTSATAPKQLDTTRAAGLTDSAVLHAIELGRNGKGKTHRYLSLANCSNFGQLLLSSGNAMRMYTVLAQGPVGRIADASAEAARKYLTFDLPDATPEMRALTLTVGVQQDLQDMSNIVVPVEHVIIRSVTGGQTGPAVQPTHIEPLSASFQNLMGAKIETQGVLATFDLRALPPGDLQIVVITTSNECHATVHEHDRDRLQ